MPDELGNPQYGDRDGDYEYVGYWRWDGSRREESSGTRGIGKAAAGGGLLLIIVLVALFFAIPYEKWQRDQQQQQQKQRDLEAAAGGGPAFTHTDVGLWCVCFSPDGKRLASASSDGIRIWDVPGGQQTLFLGGHRGAINCLCFSHDGKRLASACQDKTIKIWDLQTGKETLVIKDINPNSRAFSFSVSFSGDDKYLAGSRYVDSGSSIKIWDALNGQEIRSIKDGTPSNDVRSVSFSPSDKYLVSDSREGAKVWDGQTGRLTLIYAGHNAQVQCVAYAPNGSRVVSGSLNGLVKVWSPATGQEFLSLHHSNGWVVGVCFSCDGNRFASSDGMTAKVWDAHSGRLVSQYSASAKSICFNNDGKLLAAASSRDRTVKIFKIPE